MDPLILTKLQAFAARRRRLILLRGLLVAAALLLGTMMAVALLDRLFLLPDWLRWLLSGSAYAAVLVAEWRLGLGRLWSVPSARQLARLVEQTVPALRGDLLSAVELGEEREHFDSPVFRELVQQGVSHRLAGFATEQLLPPQLLRRSLIGVGVLAAVFVAALLFTRLQFGTMLLRALFPMANLPRVSTIHIAVLEPYPQERVVPQGDSVPLVIETTGGEVAEAYLETFATGGSRGLAQMAPQGHGRFAAQIQIAREDVQYRVRAGDALTRKYALHAAARPRVVRFQKTYRYPDYAQLPPREVTEDSGDLAALEGTEVELVLETDQPVREAELRLETGQQTTTLPLTPAGEHQLTAKVPLTASGNYRIHLLGAESGFENKFTPEYELRAEPDLIPKVELESPERDLISTNVEQIEFTGRASDDLALARLDQLYRVNDGPWQTRRLPLKPGPAAVIETRWDLSQESFRPGDIITAKLVAHDRKGSLGESRSVQITLAEAGFDSQRAAAIQEKQRLLVTVSALRTATTALDSRIDDFRKIANAALPDDQRRTPSLTALGAALDEYDLRAQAAAGQMALALHGAEPGRDAGELLLVARAIAYLRAGDAPLRWFLQQVTADAADPAVARGLLRECLEGIKHLSRHSHEAEDACRAAVVCAELDLAAQNLQVVWKEQQELVEEASQRPAAESAWVRIASRAQAVLAEAGQVEELYAATALHATSPVGQRLDRARLKLQDQQAAYLRALETPPGPAMLGAVQNYGYAVTDALVALFELSHDYLEPPLELYRSLRQSLGPAWQSFEKLRKEIEPTLRDAKLSETARASLAGAKWDFWGDAWKSYGDWEEVRPDADVAFVQDLRKLGLALPAWRAATLRPGLKDERLPAWTRLSAVDQSFRLLEGAHDLQELAAACEALAAAEKWENVSPRAHSGNALDWQWMWERLQLQAAELTRLQLTDSNARGLVQQAAAQVELACTEPPAQAIAAEMAQRLSQTRVPISMMTEARQLADRLREALEILQPGLETARQQIQSLTPKLSERMAELAQQASELQKRATQQAAEPAGDEPAAQDAAAQELAAQRQLNGELETIRDALRADAHAQDLMDEQSRERARDADDALAMLREPPERAEQSLAEAAATEATPADRQTALQAAAEQQQKLSQALDQIAKHYDALDRNEATDESRTALRQEEEKLGVKQELDAQYEQAKRLAEAAQSPPEEMLKKLEEALPQNPLMRQELHRVSKNTLEQAGQKLAASKAQEQRIANAVQKLATEAPDPAANATVEKDGPATSNPALTDAADQQSANAETTASAGDDIARSSRHEDRLSNRLAGRDLQALGEQVQQTATKEMSAALKALTKSPSPADAQPAVESANQSVQRDLEALNNALKGNSEPSGPAPDSASSPSPSPDSTPPERTPATASAPQVGAAGATATAAPPQGSPPSSPTGSTPDATPHASPSPASPPATALAANNQLADFDEEVFDLSALPPPNTVASPEQQRWMARALDSLDAAVNARTSSPTAPADEKDGASKKQEGQEEQEGKDGQQAGAKGQEQAAKAGSQEGKDSANAAKDSMQQAQQAMSAAAKAQAASMRSNRNPPQGEERPSTAKGGEQADSKTGSRANGDSDPYGALPKANAKAGGDWGRLPKKMADQLTQGQREGVAPEYRSQIETYYRVIAERAKKP